MYAEDLVSCCFIIDASSKGQVLEEVVHLLEDTRCVVDVFAEPLFAFMTEAKILVDVAIFMVPAKKEYLQRIFELEGEQEADDLETLAADIHVVAQEEVVQPADVATFRLVRRSFPEVKEPHQVVVVSVDVAENFGRRIEFDNSGLGLEDVGDFRDELEHQLFLDGEGLHHGYGCLAVLWLQQFSEEDGVKLFVLVALGGERSELVPHPLVLVTKLVDGDVADDVRKVLSWFLFVTCDGTCADVGSAGQSELLLTR